MRNVIRSEHLGEYGEKKKGGVSKREKTGISSNSYQRHQRAKHQASAKKAKDKRKNNVIISSEGGGMAKASAASIGINIIGMK